MTDSLTLACGNCGSPFPAQVFAPPGNQNLVPCPVCGSMKRHANITLSDTNGKVRDTLQAKVRNINFPSRKRIPIKFFLWL